MTTRDSATAVLRYARRPPLLARRQAAAWLLALALVGGAAGGVDRAWVGAAGGDWFAEGNWNPAGVPAATDTVRITSGTPALTNATAPLAAFSITNATLTFSGWSTTLSADLIEIRDKGVLTHTICDTNATVAAWVTNRVSLIASDVTIHAGGKINDSQKGFRLKQGPGANAATSQGGSYGGNAGGRTGGTYGSALYPEHSGSGGYAGAAGGAVKIAATGTVRVDGIIDADTIYAQEGPGSGGGILIICKRFVGSGTVKAIGGNASGSKGAGAGGRIAVLQMDVASYERVRAGQTNGTEFVETAPDTFAGIVSAAAGTGLTTLLAQPGTVRFGSLLPRGFMLLLR